MQQGVCLCFRLRASKVLLVGLNGLGAEICKNIVLCGVKSLTLLDDQVVTTRDFTAQFLIPRTDIGKNVRIINVVRDRSLITGEGGMVQKRGGSDIFVHEKRGGQKFLCNINTYLPA